MLRDIICKCYDSFKDKIYYHIYAPYLKNGLKTCGENVVISPQSRIEGRENVSLGNHVYIGPGAVFYSTVAQLKIGNYVTLGPNVTIITGDHRTDVVGKYMSQVTDKIPDNDKDVIIEDDVWIGTGVIILKGVTIGRGSIVAAGAVVTKDIEPYSKYISLEKCYRRFADFEIKEHERLLALKNADSEQ